MVQRQIRNISGWMLIFFGSLLALTPIPIGLIMVLTGIALVARDSRRLQDWLRRRRHHNRGMDTKIRGARGSAPAFVRHVIDLTDPDYVLSK